MMEERTTGIVLRTRLLTETSLIVHWLTADAGRIATVARGARRPKSPFRGKLDLFHAAAISFRRSRRSELHTLCEVMLEETFPALRADWHRLSQAAYGAALVEQTTETETPLPETYAQFRGFLEVVARRATSPLPVLAFELKHLAELGLLPDLERESLPAESGRLAADLLRIEWERFEDVATSAAAVPPLVRFLHGFLIYHLDRLPRGRAEALG